MDLFSGSEDKWWNYVVCRTGPYANNIRIPTAAKQRGWKWNPHSSGFSRAGPFAGQREEHKVESEEDVFSFVGLPYLQPWERN